MSNIKTCVSCKHFEQGVNCGYCANENQTNLFLKSYVSYNSYCTLHEDANNKSIEFKNPDIECINNNPNHIR